MDDKKIPAQMSFIDFWFVDRNQGMSGLYCNCWSLMLTEFNGGCGYLSVPMWGLGAGNETNKIKTKSNGVTGLHYTESKMP